MTETQTLIDLEPDQRRNTISELVTAKDVDGLREMGIEVIEEEGNKGEGCYEAAFPLSIYPKDILLRVVPASKTTDSPKIGDLAVYFNTKIMAIAHVGRVVTENGKIQSRWGSGGMLCKHLPLDIPVFFGKELKIYYFSEPK